MVWSRLVSAPTPAAPGSSDLIVLGASALRNASTVNAADGVYRVSARGSTSPPGTRLAVPLAWLASRGSF